MNKVELKIFAIVRTQMDEQKERENVKEKNRIISENDVDGKSKYIDEDTWIKRWGELDVDVIMKYSIKHGISALEFANTWISLDGVKQLEIYNQLF